MFLEVSKIRRDPELQSRVSLDTATIEEYADAMREGAEFPSVVVFHDGDVYWLVDGFHRVAAYEAVGQPVPCDVRSGDRRAALAYSLHANHANGRRRTLGDLKCAYDRACKGGFCRPDCIEEVQQAIRCSKSHAANLTRESREEAERQRNEQIRKLSESGKSQRKIAAEVGVSQPTVARVVGDSKDQSVQMNHPVDQVDGEWKPWRDGYDRKIKESLGPQRGPSSPAKVEAESRAVKREIEPPRQPLVPNVPAPQGNDSAVSSQIWAEHRSDIMLRIKCLPPDERSKLFDQITAEYQPAKPIVEKVVPLKLGTAADLLIPDDLNTQHFAKAWVRWCTYCENKGFPLTLEEGEELLKDLNRGKANDDNRKAKNGVRRIRYAILNRMDRLPLLKDIPKDSEHPTEKQVLGFAEARGVSQVIAVEFWRHYQAQGWKRSNGQPIDDWHVGLELWAENQRKRDGIADSATIAAAVEAPMVDPLGDDHVRKVEEERRRFREQKRAKELAGQ